MSVLILVGICMAAGLAIRLLRRWPRLVFVATLIGAGLIGAILATAPDAPLTFFGRSLALDTPARTFLIPSVAIALALAFFGPLNFDAPSNSPAQILVNSQGAFFFWALAPLIIAITLDSFPLAIFFWVVGMIVLMLLAHPHREGSVGGAAQFVLVAVLAASSLLLASRIIDLYPYTPENLDLIRTTVMLLALGMGLMLAVVPMHIWLGPLVDEMPTLGVAFLVGVAQPVGLWLLFERMNNLFWLTDKSPLSEILFFGGAITVPVGALLALTEKRDGRFVAYVALAAMGHTIMGLGSDSQLALTGAMTMLLNRAAGTALIAGGFSFVRHHFERPWQVVGAGAILCGGFALAGIPPTLGFAARWEMYREFAATNANLLVIFIASSMAIAIAAVRVTWEIASTSTEPTDEIKIVPYLSTVVVVVLVAFLVIAGLQPQWLASRLAEVIETARYLK